MSRRRTFLLVVALVTTLGLTLGTGGFSSVSADRGIDIAVTDDEQAFLAFSQNTTDTTNGTTAVDVTVGNQYPAGTALSTVTVTINGTAVDLAENGQLSTGASRTYTFESVACDETIEIEAAGSGVEVSFNRSVSCR